MVLALEITVLLEVVYFMDNVNFATDNIFLFTLTTWKLRAKFRALMEDLNAFYGLW